MTACTHQCESGRTCVCSVETVRPAWMNGAAEVAPYHQRTCDELGVCQGRGGCDCLRPSVGNVQFDDPIVDVSGNEWGTVALVTMAALGIFLASIALLIDMHWDYLVTTAAGLLHQTFFTN